MYSWSRRAWVLLYVIAKKRWSYFGYVLQLTYFEPVSCKTVFLHFKDDLFMWKRLLGGIADKTSLGSKHALARYQFLFHPGVYGRFMAKMSRG